ncbi:MAG TPA: glycosyltransferase family 39 protein [Rhodanobacteraceae bacterium]|nr:glycosyltransferase family 39 protein [Rhodanobacteraceae bacterium]
MNRSTSPLPSVPPLSRDERWQVWLFFGFALLLLAVGLGLRDPWPSDEPRFALVARQMVQTGQWLFPHRGIELYADKPPLFMWLQACAWWLTQGWRGWFLLPSLASALGTLALTYDLGRRLWNHRAGLYAAIALLFVFEFTYQMKRAQIDPLVTFWIMLANWGLLIHCLRGPNWRAWVLGCIAAGLGVITKGVGILALLMLVPYAWACWRTPDRVARPGWRDPRWLLGIPAFVLPILAWGVPMLLVAHFRDTAEYHAYVNDILFHQTVGRATGSWSHPQPPWYFLGIVLFNWFPLSLLYIGGVRRWWRALREGEPRIVLPLVWSILVIVFFSIQTGKRDVYIMPVIPMVVLSLAPYIGDMLRTRWLRWSAFGIGLVGGIVIVITATMALNGHDVFGFNQHVAARGLEEERNALCWMIISIGAVLALAAAACRPRHGVVGLLAGLTGLWMIWSLWAYPLLNPSSSAAGIMREARVFAGPQARIGLVGPREENLFMAVGPTREFGMTRPLAQQFAAAVAWQARDPSSRWIFSLGKAMGDCVDRAEAHKVGHSNRRQWWLFRANAVVPGCTPRLPATEDNDDDNGN